ncbi:hypothetical protein EV279_0945 [Microbacterium sp. BK668]|nr:hypothetical protein EV279_0945 [Microbacterium sp. BK668]
MPGAEASAIAHISVISYGAPGIAARRRPARRALTP